MITCRLATLKNSRSPSLAATPILSPGIARAAVYQVSGTWRRRVVSGDPVALGTRSCFRGIL